MTIEENVKEVFGGICPIPKDCDGNLEINFLDELDLVDLVQALEEQFEITIDDSVPKNWKTIGDIFEYIQKTSKQEL